MSGKPTKFNLVTCRYERFADEADRQAYREMFKKRMKQVYGKEIASIILDNSALCYLKTNTVETATVVANKLGKATIETSSISQSTDQFKIGANKTTSLLGRELLTPNEIIALKYKTIIFPTVSNPIFRDTYLYTDIFKQYKDFSPIDRVAKIIKKNTENYYTVEQMKANYESTLEDEIQSAYDSYDKEISKPKKIKNNIVEEFIKNIKEVINVKRTSFFNGTYSVEIDKKLSKFEENKIIELLEPFIAFEMFINNNSSTTLKVWREVDQDKQL